MALVDRRRAEWLERWWLSVAILLLILASDYKFRVRDPRTTLAGSVDSAILFELLLYGTVAVYLFVTFARRPRPQHARPVLYLACLFVFLMVLSVIYTAYPQYALVRAVQMCVLLGIVLAAARVATSGDMHRLAHAYVVAVGASVVYGVAVPSVPQNIYLESRFTWVAIHPTVSGVLAGLATVIVVAYLAAGSAPRRGPMWSRWAYVAALVVVGGATLATQTRGAVAGAVVASIVVLLSLRRGRARLELFLALVIIMVGLALAASTTVVRYFERGETAENLATLNSRTDLWESAIEAIQQKPMFGYGVTSSRGIFYEQIGLGGGHNAVVNVFVELGAVGLITWLALVMTLVVGAWRLPARRFSDLRVDRALLLGILTFLMVDGLFFEGPGSVANVASTWFFVSIAWLLVAQRTIEERRAPVPLISAST